MFDLVVVVVGGVLFDVCVFAFAVAMLSNANDVFVASGVGVQNMHAFCVCFFSR